MYNSIKVDSDKQLLYVYDAFEGNTTIGFRCKNILDYEYSENVLTFNFSDTETLESKINLISEEDFLYAVYSVVATYAYVKNATNGKAEILSSPKYCFYNAIENSYKFAFASSDNDKVDTFVKDFVWNLIFDAAYTTSEIDVVSELLNFLRTSRRVSAEDVLLIIELCKYGESIVNQYRKSTPVQNVNLQAPDNETMQINNNFADELLSAEIESTDLKFEIKDLTKDIQENFIEKVSVNQFPDVISAGECKVDFSSFLSGDIGFSGAHTRDHIPENMSRREEYHQSRNKTVSDFSGFLFEQSDCSHESKPGVFENCAENAADKAILGADEKYKTDSDYFEDLSSDEEPVSTKDVEEADSLYIEEKITDEEIDCVEEEYEIDHDYFEDVSFDEEPVSTEDVEEADSEYIEEKFADEEINCVEDEYKIYKENIDDLFEEVENKIDCVKESGKKNDIYENIWSFSGHSETDSAELSFLSGESFNITKPVCNIGRNSAWSDIELKDGRVSRQHAVIEYKNSNYYIYDAKSANGTYINGKKMPAGETKLLTDGDIIKIGIFELHFRYTNKK